MGGRSGRCGRGARPSVGAASRTGAGRATTHHRPTGAAPVRATARSGGSAASKSVKVISSLLFNGFNCINLVQEGLYYCDYFWGPLIPPLGGPYVACRL